MAENRTGSAQYVGPVTLPSPPISQNVITGSTSIGSAIYLNAAMTA
jgi:hypothetical protein